MDSHFDIEDVEMIPLDNNKVDSEVVEIIEAAPVMDVRGLEEQEPAHLVEQAGGLGGQHEVACGGRARGVAKQGDPAVLDTLRSHLVGSPPK